MDTVPESQQEMKPPSARVRRRPRPLLALLAVVALLATVIATPSPSSAETTTIGSSMSIPELITADDFNWLSDAPVLRLYQAMFARDPDLDGAKYWLSIRRLGFNALDIAEFMALSPEFANTYDGTTNAQFTESVYRNVLGRAFDEEGYQYWLELLNKGPNRGGLDRPSTVFYVTDNDEFRDNYPFGSPNNDYWAVFGDGVFPVAPNNLPAETYVSIDPQPGCSWERRDSSGNVIASNSFDYQQPMVIVEIVFSDAEVASDKCGTWYPIRFVDLVPVDAFTTGPAGTTYTATQIVQGFYIAKPLGSDCFYSGLNGFTNEDSARNGVEYVVSGQQMIFEVDGFDSGIEVAGGCGDWTWFDPDTLTQLNGFSDGIWWVGRQIPAGQYESSGVPGQNCQIQRLRGFRGIESDVIEYLDNPNPGDPSVFTIIEGSDDVGIKSQNCGNWRKIG